jgi:Cupredoxin-like domain
MSISASSRPVGICLAAGLGLLVLLPAAHAQAPKEITITYRNKHFSPAEVSAPGNTPLVIRIKNNDPDPMEFESETLHFEQIINGKDEATIKLQPLKPGKYGFFDDDHATSEGNLIVK